MYKLQTNIENFKYNVSRNTTGYTATWFILDEDEEARCMTYEELNIFQNFTLANPLNFPGEKNYSICDESECPYIGIYGTNRTMPKYIIIRKEPYISTSGMITEAMDIVLVDTNGYRTHNYNLPFDVIGQLY